jgi:predicted DCC family thiol-disulfide oxidoreductase YuxK
MYHHKQPLILFDGFCHLCSKSVLFIIKREKKKIFSFIPLQAGEVAKIEGLPIHIFEPPASLVLIENNKVYRKSGAALRIARHLIFPWNMFYCLIIIPPFLRNWVYNFISVNRYRWFGKRETCYLGVEKSRVLF